MPSVAVSTSDENWDSYELVLMARIERFARDSQALGQEMSAWFASRGERALRGIAQATPAGMQFAVPLWLTPRHGEVMLEHRQLNRPRRALNVQSFRRAMKAQGDWQRNGQTVSFAAGTGETQDGSHRAEALAGCPDGTIIVQLAAFGVEGPETVDSGAVRTLADSLKREGYPNAHTLAGFIVRIEGVERGCPVSPGRTKRLGRTEAVEYLQAHPEYIETARRAKNHCPEWTPPAIAATALTLLRRAAAGLGHPGWADDFYGGWLTGESLEPGNQILLLRKWIGKRAARRNPSATAKDKKDAPDDDLCLCYVVMAWNNWTRGIKHQKLQAPQRGLTNSNFPRMLGYELKKQSPMTSGEGEGSV